MKEEDLPAPAQGACGLVPDVPANQPIGKGESVLVLDHLVPAADDAHATLVGAAHVGLVAGNDIAVGRHIVLDNLPTADCFVS